MVIAYIFIIRINCIDEVSSSGHTLEFGIMCAHGKYKEIGTIHSLIVLALLATLQTRVDGPRNKPTMKKRDECQVSPLKSKQ